MGLHRKIGLDRLFPDRNRPPIGRYITSAVDKIVIYIKKQSTILAYINKPLYGIPHKMRGDVNKVE